MASEFMVNLKEEVTCPICLDLMVEPVSADCGHSFCRACITLNYESSKSKEEEFICPVCRVSYLFGNLRPNRHVANIVERLKGFKSSPEEQKVFHCARHGEKLQLFCEKDKVAICWICERSQEHRGHQTALIEEVACEYKEKLQAALQKLMADKKESENWKDDLQQERTYWESKIQKDVENVQTEFKRMEDILDSEKKNELQKLMQEKEDIINSLAESENEHAQQSKLLGDLISDVEHQLGCSAMEMLQGVDSIINRSHTFSLTKPKTIPKEQRRVFRAPDLQGMLQVLQEVTEAQRYWVRVTLVENNHPKIAITVDKKQIRYEDHQTRNSKARDESCHEGVMGHPALQSGKHYWEVDVSGKSAWVLGLCDGSYLFNPIFLSHPSPLFRLGLSNDLHYQPKYGFWVIGLQKKYVYNVFEECSLTGKPSTLTLSLMVPPCRVGVFLDYAAGTLSFYNISHHGTLIYRFCSVSFPDRVFPYFNPMRCSEPMTVCWPDS
nr:tripartite motif-containing protein 12A-like [Meriones unguiculatus]